MARDNDYIRMIGSKQWRDLRRWMLSACPLCDRCRSEGRITAATEVHHIRPVEYGVTVPDKRRLMFDTHNLRALCHDCHVRVHTEMGRSGAAANRRRNSAQMEEIRERLFGEDEG